jgi:hypothetical protein
MNAVAPWTTHIAYVVGLLDPPSIGGMKLQTGLTPQTPSSLKFEKQSMSLVALDDPSEKPTVIDHIPPWSGHILFVTDKS